MPTSYATNPSSSGEPRLTPNPGAQALCKDAAHLLLKVLIQPHDGDDDEDDVDVDGENLQPRDDAALQWRTLHVHTGSSSPFGAT